MAAMQEHFPVVGVLGGGQLGRMMAEAGHNMGVRVAILDPKGEQSPAGMVTRDAYTGDFKDEATVKKFCADSGCSVLTVRQGRRRHVGGGGSVYSGCGVCSVCSEGSECVCRAAGRGDGGVEGGMVAVERGRERETDERQGGGTEGEDRERCTAR